MAMVDSDKGITNLHVPNDVDHRRVDAGRRPRLRADVELGRQAPGDPRDGARPLLRPDVPAVFDDCRTTAPRPGDHGLGAQRRADGPEGRGVRLAPDDLHRARGRDCAGCGRTTGAVLMEHDGRGRHLADVRVRDIPIQDWVKLAVTRARITGAPGVLLPRRGPRPRPPTSSPRCSVPRRPRHHRPRHPHPGPRRGDEGASARIREGKDTISVTGNVLRDYLTDLFPILELGTSAKMLSVVPLLAGGGLFETGRGRLGAQARAAVRRRGLPALGLLGEFSALGRLAGAHRPPRATPRLRCSPTRSTPRSRTFLDENKSPARKVGQIDNRGSHFYLALVLGRGVGRPDDDAELAARFAPVAKRCGRERGDDQRASCSPPRASRSTWAATTTPTPPRRCGDAPERDAQRGHRLPVAGWFGGHRVEALGVNLLGDDAIRDLLPAERVVAVLGELLRAQAKGEFIAPARAVLPLGHPTRLTVTAGAMAGRW
jgi:isocitrate dehydrogenase